MPASTNTITAIKTTSSSTVIVTVSIISEGRKLLLSKNVTLDDSINEQEQKQQQQTHVLDCCEGKQIVTACISSASSDDSSVSNASESILLYFAAVATDGTVYLGRTCPLVSSSSSFSPHWIGKYSGLTDDAGHQNNSENLHQDMTRQEMIEKERENSFFLHNGEKQNGLLHSPLKQQQQQEQRQMKEYKNTSRGSSAISSASKQTAPPLVAIHCNDVLPPFSSEDERTIWICVARAGMVTILSVQDFIDNDMSKNADRTSAETMTKRTTVLDQQEEEEEEVGWKTTKVSTSSEKQGHPDFENLPSVPSRGSSPDFFDPDSMEEETQKQTENDESSLSKRLLQRTILQQQQDESSQIVNNIKPLSFCKVEYRLELHLSNVWSISTITPSFSSFSSSSAFPFFIVGVPRGVLLLSRRSWSFNSAEKEKQNNNDAGESSFSSTLASSTHQTAPLDVFYPWNEAQWKQRAIFEKSGGGVGVESAWRLCPVSLQALSVVALPVVISKTTDSMNTSTRTNIEEQKQKVGVRSYQKKQVPTSPTHHSSPTFIQRFFAVGASDGSVSLIRFNEKLQTAQALWTMPNCHENGSSVSSLLCCSFASSAIKADDHDNTIVSTSVAIFSSGFSDGKIKIIWSDINGEVSDNHHQQQREFTIDSCCSRNSLLHNNENNYPRVTLALLSPRSSNLFPTSKGFSVIDFVSVSQVGELKWWRSQFVLPSSTDSFIDCRMMVEKTDPSEGAILPSESIAGMFLSCSEDKQQKTQQVRIVCGGDERVPQLVTLYGHHQNQNQNQNQENQTKREAMMMTPSRNLANDSNSFVSSPQQTQNSPSDVEALMKSVQKGNYHAFNSTPGSSKRTTANNSSGEALRHQFFSPSPSSSSQKPEKQSRINESSFVSPGHVDQELAKSLREKNRELQQQTRIKNSSSVFVDPMIFSSSSPFKQQEEDQNNNAQQFIATQQEEEQEGDAFDDVEQILLNFDRTLNPASPVSSKKKTTTIFYNSNNNSKHDSTTTTTPSHRTPATPKRKVVSTPSQPSSSKNRISPIPSTTTPISNKRRQTPPTKSRATKDQQQQEELVLSSSSSKTETKFIHPHPNLFQAFSSPDGTDVRNMAKSNPKYIHRPARHLSPSGTIRPGAQTASVAAAAANRRKEQRQKSPTVNSSSRSTSLNASTRGTKQSQKPKSEQDKDDSHLAASSAKVDDADATLRSTTTNSTRKAYYNTVRLPDEVWNRALEVLADGEEKQRQGTPEKIRSQDEQIDAIDNDSTLHKTTRLSSGAAEDDYHQQQTSPIARLLSSRSASGKLKANMRQGIFSASPSGHSSTSSPITTAVNRHPITLALPPVLARNGKQKTLLGVKEENEQSVGGKKGTTTDGKSGDVEIVAVSPSRKLVSSDDQMSELQKLRKQNEDQQKEIEKLKKKSAKTASQEDGDEIPQSPRGTKKGNCMS